MIDLKTGEVIKVFDSISSASRETHISLGNICAVCNGKRPSAGKYFWKYEE